MSCCLKIIDPKAFSKLLLDNLITYKAINSIFDDLAA